MHTPRNIGRITFVALCLSLLSIGRSEAQQLIRTDVEVSVSALSEADRNRLTGLDEYVRYALESYRAPQGASLVPKEPMKVVVRVSFAPEVSISGDFLCEIQFMAYRPVFDSEDDTVIFSAIDRQVPVDPTALSSLPSTLGALPSDPFLLRIHYLATLSLLMYYDSFDLNGGDAYLAFLRANQGVYAKALSEGASSISPSQTLSLSHIPGELDTEEGLTFRELWLLFHLELLDGKLRTDGAEQTLTFALNEWTKLAETQRVTSLFQLLRDTKTPDVARLLGMASKETVMEAKKSVPYLFPSFSSQE